MAAFDAFLTLDGIKGESKDKKFKESLQIESFSWGMVNVGAYAAGGKSAAGKVSFQDFHFTVRASTASPQLAMFCAFGKLIPTALLTLRKSGETQLEYCTFKMGDATVSSFQTGGAQGTNTISLDQVTLSFAKMIFEYREQRDDGGGSAINSMSYDLRAANRLE
jgi:type VI secretion system secreted protein Hcp